MIVGVLGAGQLGRMLALAGLPLGIRSRFLDPTPGSPAGHAGELVTAAYDDPEAQARFADGLKVCTWEFENVSLAAARAIAARVPLHPDPEVLAAKQDRLDEKRFFRSLGIPTAPFAEVSSREGLDAAVAEVGLPAVLKTRRDGYDGKGQRVLKAAADLDAAWSELGGKPLILEGFVPFVRECSILAVRGRDGSLATWPLVENEHRGGILHRSVSPMPHAWVLQQQAEAHAKALCERLGYVGVLAIEFFQDGDRLLANEFAPRVHNSGHWTIEGSVTSQFENHLRAVCGLPLGSTAPRGCSTMVNLVGSLPDPAAVLAIPGAHLHRYGKEPRPGRKVGHVTVVADSARDCAALAARVESLLSPANPPG